jgi:hypothetical protein
MRILCAVVFALSASVAGAQMVLIGVGGGVTWEVDAEAAPDSDWNRGDDASVTFALGAHLTEDTVVRAQLRDLSRTTLVGGAPWNGRIRAYTIGTDYLVPGTFGEACFSGGIGAYRLDLAGENGPDGVETDEFGWYVGIGEWFRVSRYGRIIGEIVMDRTGHEGSPTLVTANLMLAIQF